MSEGNIEKGQDICLKSDLRSPGLGVGRNGGRGLPKSEPATPSKELGSCNPQRVKLEGLESMA